MSILKFLLFLYIYIYLLIYYKFIKLKYLERTSKFYYINHKMTYYYVSPFSQNSFMIEFQTLNNFFFLSIIFTL